MGFSENRKMRVLMIGAHPDDCEFKTAGTALKLREAGHHVKFISLTSGDMGHHVIYGKELAEIRKKEAKKAADIAGIKSLVLDIGDGRLEANLENRQKLICLIRGYRPHMIFTHRPYDYHPDHRNTSVLVQDASFLLMVPGICPEIPALDYQPVILFMQDDFTNPVRFNPHILVDIEDVLDRKILMLDAHISQVYEWLPYVMKKQDVVPTGKEERSLWLKEIIKARDAKVAQKYSDKKTTDIKYAEAFEVSEYGGDVTKSVFDMIEGCIYYERG
jgi:N-acetylglucosamine malate deacetylase 1